MSSQSLLKRCSATLAIFSVALLVSGTKACREDYDLGSQSANTGTPTPTPDVGTDGTTTPTATATPTTDDGTDPNPEVSPTPTTAPAAPVSFGEDDPADIFQELSKAGEGSAAEKVGAVARASADGNWLGKNFNGGNNNTGNAGAWLDSDGDGFSDGLENDLGSDPLDPLFSPDAKTSTDLNARVRAIDNDLDGLSNDEELALGTDPASSDSDGDFRPDGAEVLSKADPKNRDDKYLDEDGDGLSDAYEIEQGLNTSKMDSDNDGLRDDLEIVVGSNPLKADSDNDGISDGKEFDLGSDPTVADNLQAQ
jgi:hypothetical protein